MPMTTGSDTRMYSPRSESMLGYTNDDDNYRHGVGDPKEMERMKDEKQAKKGKPMAKIISYGFGGVEPDEMGLGPIPASKMALKKVGLSIDDLDLVESNEAFAAQACAVNKELGLDEAKVNVNGGAIALGHPVGATGSIIMTKLVYECKKDFYRNTMKNKEI